MLLQDISLAILSGMWTVVVWTWWIVVPVILYFAWKNKKKTEYVESIETIVISVKIPKNNEKGPVAAEMMFAALHGILHPKDEQSKGITVQEHLSFEIVSTLNMIEFFIWTPKHLKDFVEGQVYAQYPTAEISVVDDYSQHLDIDNNKVDDAVVGTELTLTKEEIYPIKTFQNFDVDPLAGITGMLSKIEHGSEQVWIQILAQPVDDEWRNGSLNHIESKKNGISGQTTWVHKLVDLLLIPLGMIPNIITALIVPMTPEQKKKAAEAEKKAKEKAEKDVPRLTHAEETELSAIEEKSAKLGYQVLIRVVYLAKTPDKAKERIQAVIGAFKQFNTTNLNGFMGKGLYTGGDFLNAYRARYFSNPGFILNIEELASLYHLPHVSVETPNIVWTSSKKGEPPSSLHTIEDGKPNEEDLTVIGKTTFRNGSRLFGITRDDRRRHMYIIGKSGTGKSRLLENLAIQDIQRGEGVAVVDPHGELIERVMKFIPKERIPDVVYLNPADKEFPLAFNPLESTPDMREETAKGFIAVLKRMFGFSWGPRLEYVLNHTVLALSEVPGSTMLGIVRMLTDRNFRKRIVEQINDPVVQMFWLKEFSSYNDKMETETVAPILNKVGQFTSSPIIRNIVGQPHSTVDFADIMNSGKILLVDLSTGKIGEVNSALLGSLIITKIQLAAMQRAFMPEEERRDFYLYVDEFQNFATDSFATILSEARKYRLSLTVANQYIAQMEETVRDAVFGNVGTLISFRVGATDASFLEKEFEPVFTQNDLINLDNRHIYLNMLINGVTSVPFSAMTSDSPEITNDLTPVIIASSRKKYGKAVSEVEEDIRHWYNVDSVVAGVNANEGDNPIILKNKPNENKNSETGKPKGDKGKNQGLKLTILENTIQKKAGDNVVINEKTATIAELEKTADYIVRHKDKDNKYVFLPENAPHGLVPDARGRKKGAYYIKGGKKIYLVKIDMYEPQNYKVFPEGKAPDIWVGTPKEMMDQLEAIAAGLGGATKFLGVEDHSKNPNILQQLMPLNSKTEDSLQRQPVEKEIPQTIAEKIGQESVDGLKRTVEPVMEEKAILEPADKPETIKDDQNIKLNNKEIKEVLISVADPKGVYQKINENTAHDIKQRREITPEEFGNLKTIQPHERLGVKGSKEIKAGEEIVFNHK